MTPAMFTPSRELREYIRARLDMAVRARTNYATVERRERELWAGHPFGPAPVPREEILRAIRRFAREHGRRPSHDEWKTLGLRPNVAVIRVRFGSWNEALKAAGLKPFKPKRATRTRCANGHRWTQDTLYIRDNGKRYCRQCQRESRARSYARTREAA